MVLLKFYYFGWFFEGLWWFIILDCFVKVILGGFVEGLWWFIIWGWRSRAVAQEAIVGPPLSTSFKISSALGEVLFYNVAREVLKIEITFKSDWTNSVNENDTICQNRWHCYRPIVRSQLYDFQNLLETIIVIDLLLQLYILKILIDIDEFIMLNCMVNKWFLDNITAQLDYLWKKYKHLRNGDRWESWNVGCLQFRCH